MMWLVRRRRDDGAVLIFALILITVVALVTGAMLLQGGTNLAATVGLRRAAGSAYAADAAAKEAINALEQGKTCGAPGASPDVVLPSGFFGGGSCGSPAPTWVFDNNVDNTGCFGATSLVAGGEKWTLDLPTFYTDAQSGTAQTATVVCSPVAGTGILQPGPANPIVGGAGGGPSGGGVGRALTLLGPGSSSLNVNVLGGSGRPFAMHGDIAVQGQMTLTGGSIYTNGTFAASSCSIASGSSIIADGGSTCSASGTVLDPGADPSDTNGGWVPNINSVPGVMGTWTTTAPASALSPGPAVSTNCTPSQRTAYFFPGYYDDAYSLNNATSACATVIFEPGNYYFDFHNNTSDPTVGTWGHYAMAGMGSDQWNITNTNVIAGDTTVAGLTTSPPGSCANPIDKSSVNGVQFIFGGDSRIQMQSGGTGQSEICASTSSTSDPPVAIFGLDGHVPVAPPPPASAPLSTSRGQLASGYATSVTATNSSVSATSTTSATSAFTFVPSPATTLTGDVAVAADSKVATFVHATTDPTGTAALTLMSLAPSVTVPPGSILKSATLKVWHYDSDAGGSNNVTPGLQIQAPGMASPVVTSSQPVKNNTTTATEDDIDLTSDLAPIVNAGNLGASSLLFTETAKGTATAQVDAVSLVLTYFPPFWRGQTTTAIPGNCIATSACQLIGMSGGSSYKGSFVIQGATYAPGADLNLQLGNQAKVVSLRWGLVAKDAALQSQNSFTFAYPVISIPDKSPGFGPAMTAVDLKVYLCPAATASCLDASGTPISSANLALTSRVKLTDPVDPTTKLVTPTPGKRKIQVLSWAEQR